MYQVRVWFRTERLCHTSAEFRNEGQNTYLSGSDGMKAC